MESEIILIIDHLHFTTITSEYAIHHLQKLSFWRSLYKYYRKAVSVHVVLFYILCKNALIWELFREQSFPFFNLHQRYTLDYVAKWSLFACYPYINVMWDFTFYVFEVFQMKALKMSLTSEI